MSFFSHENFRYSIKCFSQKIVVPFEKIYLFRAKEISRQKCFILLFQDRISLILFDHFFETNIDFILGSWSQ